MTDTLVSLGEDRLAVTLPDGSAAELPLIWLRHNCPSILHPDTQERIVHLLDLPPRPRAKGAEMREEALHVDWEDGHQSRYAIDWLLDYVPGRPRPDPANIPREAWRGDLGSDALPHFAAADLLADDSTLLAWMIATRRLGVSLVDGVAEAEGSAVAGRIAHLRETNFGRTFEVRSKPNPNNLAYTAEALPLHTDLPNQEMPPGFQFLHCLANEASGGGSVLVDGVAVAEALRQTAPAEFDLLARQPVPFRFHDQTADVRSRRPMISVAEDGAVTEVRYSPHLMDVPDMAPERLLPWYDACRRMMAIIEDPDFAITLKLTAGQMLVFDNRRVLHGRESFDPMSGRRHLQGFYVDWGDFDSRLRVLTRAQAISLVA